MRSIQKFFTHCPVSTFDRVPFQLTGEPFLYGMALSLEKPDLAIMVEIMKGACCLSVVEEYFELFKYNIRLCGMTEEERVAEKSR